MFEIRYSHSPYFMALLNNYDQEIGKTCEMKET